PTRFFKFSVKTSKSDSTGAKREVTEVMDRLAQMRELRKFTYILSQAIPTRKFCSSRERVDGCLINCNDLLSILKK
ncbi:MAG TPA: hypothetical protein V6D31_00575, partial [Candidatus Sericytochromatia bacterium]